MNVAERRLMANNQFTPWIMAYARPGKKPQIIDPFAYNGSLNAQLGNSLATGSTDQFVIPIQSDSDFLLTNMSGVLIDPVSHEALSPRDVTVQITDTGSGKTFFSDYTNFSLVFGLAGFPFMVPAPRLIAPNTNIQVSITNNSGATVDVYCSFFGARIYY